MDDADEEVTLMDADSGSSSVFIGVSRDPAACDVSHEAHTCCGDRAIDQGFFEEVVTDSSRAESQEHTPINRLLICMQPCILPVFRQNCPRELGCVDEFIR
jgi:hypothetical protein